MQYNNARILPKETPLIEDESRLYIPNSPLKILRCFNELNDVIMIHPLSESEKYRWVEKENPDKVIAPSNVFQYAGVSLAKIKELDLIKYFDIEKIFKPASYNPNHVPIYHVIDHVVPPAILFGLITHNNRFEVAVIDKGDHHETVFLNQKTGMIIPMTLFQFCGLHNSKIPPFMRKFVADFDLIDYIERCMYQRAILFQYISIPSPICRNTYRRSILFFIYILYYVK